IGGRPCARKEAIERLGERLKALPKTVTEQRSFPLGIYRGLKFSLCLYAYHTPEIFVEGAATRLGSLARDAGPQGLLNAVERIVGNYAEQRQKPSATWRLLRGSCAIMRPV